MSSDIVRDLNDTSLSSEQKKEVYEKWSVEYDKDLESLEFTSPRRCREAICSYIKDNRESTAILDVGAGTGLLGEQLYREGFKTIDALDPSQGMLDVAKRKGAYRKFYCNFFTSEPSDLFKSDSYDVVTSSGCFNPGHLPYDVILEMVRITKSGGIICLSCRIEHLREALEYAKFFPLCDQMERDGKWRKEEVTTYNGYLKNVDGVIIVYRVL